MKNIINVAVVSFSLLQTKKENFEKIEGFTESAAKRGADLILFPELCLTGYDFYVDEQVSHKEKVEHSESLDGEYCKKLAMLSNQLGVYTIFGMGEKVGENKIYNSAVVCGPENILGVYRKIHPWGRENTCFSKSSQPYLFKTPWGPISIGICYDSYQFPELMRYYVWKGSRLYLNPTALVEEINLSGSRQAFVNYYKPTLEYGVISNSIFIASSNLIGLDRVNFFGGGSVIIGPKIAPYEETDLDYYAGDVNNTLESIFIATLNLSLARRELCINNVYSGEPDYRFELYKSFK